MDLGWDLNDDDRDDLVVPDADGFWVLIQQEGGAFANPVKIVLREAMHERRRTLGIWPRAFNSTLLIGDVTGDGRLDVIVGQHPRHLDVFAGVPGPDLFSRRRHEVAVAVPNDQEYTWLVDLNQDGRQDILMHHPFTLRDAHGAPIRPAGSSRIG